MNYLTLINQFWRINIECPFQPSDTMLYFYLLHTCNSLGWKNPFGHSDRHLAAKIGVSVNTLRAAKIRLIKSGLIEITLPQKPSNSIEGQTLYTLSTVSVNDTVGKLTVSKNDTVKRSTVSKNDTECETVYDTNNKLNSNELKTNLSRTEKIQNDFWAFDQNLKSKFPNVAKLEQQMTLTEFNTLLQEFKISIEALNDMLEKMENYKPLQRTCRSVYFTIRSWLKKDIKSFSNHSKGEFNNEQETSLTAIKINEGPTL